jgi:hypothetical protein
MLGYIKGEKREQTMLKYSLIGAMLIATTVIIHAAGTTGILLGLRKFSGRLGDLNARHILSVLITVVIVLSVLHIIEIVVWAAAYLSVLPAGELRSFEEAVYFSFVTFTTLGYGDITLSEGLRVMSGIEALNGILLVGWTSAMLFAIVHRIWQTKVIPGSTS